MTNFHVSWKSAGKANFLKPRVIKRRAWKTLNIISTLAVVLNTGLIGALITPSQANAAVTGGYSATLVSPAAGATSSTYVWEITGSKPAPGKEISHFKIGGCWKKGMVVSAVASDGNASVENDGYVKVEGIDDGDLPITLTVTFSVEMPNTGSASVKIKGGSSYFPTITTSGPSCACNLVVEKQVDKLTADPGDVLTYTISYENKGGSFCTGGGVKIYDQPSTGVSVDKTIASWLTNTVQNDQDYHSGDPAPEVYPGTFNGTSSKLLGNLLEIGPGEKGTITLKLRVNQSTEQCAQWDVWNSGWTDGNEPQSDVQFQSPKTSIATACTGALKVRKALDVHGTGDYSIDDTLANDLGFRWGFTGDPVDRLMHEIVNPVASGAHEVTENDGAVAGYHFTGWYTMSSVGATQYSCANPEGTSLPATVTVPQGDLAQLVFCNSRDTGDLVVHKNVLNPDGQEVADTHAFSVLLNGGDQKTIAEGTDATYSNLPTGTYTIVENPDGNYDFVSYSADSDANAAGAQVTVSKGQTTELTVTNKQKSGTITGYKWDDRNGDGDWDKDFEPALPNWTINLWNEGQQGPGNIVDTDQTDSNGKFTFTVNPGTYFVNEVQQLGWNQTSTPDVIGPLVIASNSTSENNNFGNQLLCVEGPQWAYSVEDVDQGTRKDGSAVLPERSDPTLALYAADDKFFSLGKNGTITVAFQYAAEDVNGPDLSFHEVTNGRPTYPEEKATIEVSLDGTNWFSLGMISNKDNGTGVSLLDFSSTGLPWVKYVRISDATNFALHTNDADGYDLNAVDATSGICRDPQWGNLTVNKLVDVDGDGKFESGNVTAADLGFVWGLQDETPSRAMGSTQNYLPVGSYNVTENTNVANYHFTGWYAGDGSCTDPDGTTLPASVNVANQQNASITLCNARDTGKITGFKFEDWDGDGKKDGNESKKSGWTIELWSGDTKLDTRVTNAQGYYTFEDLPTGDYTVKEVQKAGWTNTTPNPVNVTVGKDQTVTVNFGNFKLGKIFGHKFEDKDGDGKKDANEQAIAGWTICLGLGDSQCVQTNGNGYYEFPNLPKGNYVVHEQTQGWWVTLPYPSGVYHNVGIDYSGDTEERNFLNFKGFNLTVKKFIDGDAKLNTTGDQTLATEPWTIEVWKNGAKIDTQQTVNGTYTWTNLGPGEYVVKEIFNANEWQALLSDNITVPNWNDDDSSKTVGEFDAESGRNVEVTFINWKRTQVQLVGSKIICQDEASLPDWGRTSVNGYIDANTATTFVNQSEGACWFAESWDFQWGFSDQVGNPGDNSGEAAGNWHTFAATDSPAAVDAFAGTKNLRVREVANNLYIPFESSVNTNSEKVSAEFYCSTDVLNFDNYEYINGVKMGENGNTPTYYCVGWNVPNQFEVDIQKTVDLEGEVQTVEAGANLTYTLNWSVTGNTPVEVKLFDQLPANTSFVSATDGGFLDGDTVRWNLGTYNPAANGSVSLTVQVSSPLDKGTEISNTGNICGLGMVSDGEPFLSNSEDLRRQKCDDSTVTTTVTSAPELGIAKVANPTTVGGNQDVTYTVTWSVAGNSKATNVVVNDPIPASTTYVSMGCGTTAGTCTMSQTGTPVSSVTWNLGTRQPGEGGTLTLVVKTAISVPNGSVIPNTADIRSEEVDPVYAQADVKAATAPQLQITKTANATIVNPGDPISYTVKVKNVGTDVAINAVMTDTLPAGFSFVSTNPAATSIVGQTATFALGNMNVGDEKTITYTVNVAPGTTAGTYDNIAKAKADNATEVSTIVPVQTRVPQVLGETTQPILQIKKTASASTVNAGDTLTYTVEIKNTGSGAAINVVLSDLLPVGFTFEGGTSTTKEWSLGDLAVGETKTVSYKATVSSSIPAGTYENLAIAQADNHGKVTSSVPVEVKRGRVLGEAVDTGAGWMDLTIAATGLGLIVLGFVLTRRNRGAELV